MSERLVTSIEGAKAVSNGLNSDELNWKPSEDSWSIAQCLEHTLNGTDLYAEKLGPAIENARTRQQGTPVDAQPRHTIMGRLIIRAVEPTATRKMSSPKLFSPATSQISGDIADRFVQSHEAIVDLMLACEELDTNRIRFGSPVSALIRINATDAFKILVTHTERHLNQAERVHQSPDFPRS